MTKILITGGAGFIGSHLCDQFVGRGCEVVCVDNLSSGSRENIKHLLANSRFTFIEHDITQPISALNNQKFDAILHFASPASPNPDSNVSYLAHPVETLMVNSLGTKLMLDLANANNCQIILASTSEVYGDPLVHPQSEDYWGNVSPHGIRSCYDEGKRFMEAISFAYYRKFRTQIKVIRIFNTYGPRMRLDEGRFIPTLMDCALNNKPFQIYGDGTVTRSFCYIDDLVAGILAVYGRDVVGEVINLGNPSEFTLNQAIEIVRQISHQNIILINKPALPDDPKRRKPNISKAKKLLGWEPHIDFAAGLQKMLDSYN